ncbi:chemotaxis protein CheB [Halopseudomonas sp.]|uniref:chemotaxis protein CheB n=1 Tax=Halopseudomonas sp. TaxID=2901191 RepID=UPI003568C1E7
MIEPAAPAIALLAGTTQKRQLLQEVLEGFGYRVIFAGAPEDLDCAALEAIEADAWLLELADESELADWLLEQSPVPVLLGAGEVPHHESEDYPRWKRRLLAKLLPLLGPPPEPQCPPPGFENAPPGLPPARCIWLLAASLGGPAAVKRFLDRLPATLPVAFVYAQHIDAGFEAQLPVILGRQNTWRVLNCVSGAHLHEGEVLVAPIRRSLSFSPEGQVRLSDTPWPGPYQPSIETLLDAVAGAFAPACGAIIFSGMGEDGVQACGRLRDQGIQVWTQDAESAACAIMPEAVKDAGYSSRQGSPEALADALRYWVAQEWPVAL